MPHSHIDSFKGLGIAPAFLAILAKNHFSTPTPIQFQCIPIAIEGKDIIGIAQTGTGKTLAFSIPMLQSLVQTGGKGLVLVPTRELAMQVSEVVQRIGHSVGLKSAVVIGGESFGRQVKQLKSHPDVIIATPGRLLDHLEQRTVNLNSVQILVLDEADRMLDMGFAPQINSIIERLASRRQTMLFSATMPAAIVAVAARHMKLPVRVEVAPAGTAPKDVSQEIFFVDGRDKTVLLENLLAEYLGSVLVFTRTKNGARKLSKQLRTAGYNTTELHSDRTQAQRRDAMHGFKLGKYRVLVATDIAARGIDVTGIELVVNYDLPENPEDYVHRIGRTGRAGAVGHAVSFAMPHQRAEVRSIEQLIRTAVPITSVPAMSKRFALAPEIEQRTLAAQPLKIEPKHAQHRRPSQQQRRSRIRSAKFR